VAHLEPEVDAVGVDHAQQGTADLNAVQAVSRDNKYSTPTGDHHFVVFVDLPYKLELLCAVTQTISQTSQYHALYLGGNVECWRSHLMP